VSEKPPSSKRLESARALNALVLRYYQECMEAKEQGKPVGWMPPMNGAIELCYAMDLQPVFPENWSPLCAAFGFTPQNFQVSEGMGYSRDLCGYLRNIVGYVHGLMKEEKAALALPEPDFLLSFGGGCVPAMKIFHLLEDRFPRARVFSADLPQVPAEEIQPHHVRYAVSEMHRLIGFLTEVTGQKLDLSRLEETVALSDQACRIWEEIMSYRRTIPAPFSASEIGIMFVMVTRQGTREAVDFLTRVRDEVRYRAEHKIGVVENEQIRLFWDNIPPWYNLGLLRAFEKMKGVAVAETYSSAWSIRLDSSDPIEALALKSLQSYSLVSCVSIRKRKEMVLKACRDYALDGAVLHRNKSCAPITLGQMDIQRALEEELGIPSVIIDGDHMDARNFSLAQFQTRIEAFMEMLKQKKGGRCA
jgi:benzoyl-CoA reductase/2-hydroxyglutaryl-CoA dehydratase subunit BcrC/BadD/HgdB